MSDVVRFQIIAIMLTIATALLIPESANAQYYDYLPVGARSIGMGGTGIASARGGEAIYCNPALMGWNESYELSLSGSFLATEILRTAHPLDRYQSDSKISTHLAALVAPLPFQEERYTIGISHSRPMEPMISYTESSGGIDMISPALSVRITDKLRFGASVNIWYGELAYSDSVAVAFTGSLYANGASYFNSGYEFEVSGINTSWGLVFTAYERYQQHKLYLGLMAKAPLELETRVTYDQHHPGGTNNYPSIDIPASVGFGICWVIHNKTTISADYEYRSWQGEQQQWPGLATNSMVPAVVQPFNETTNHLMMGAEYKLRAGDASVPLRMGIRLFETPYTSFEGDAVIAEALSLGIGMLTNTFKMDLAYERSVFTQHARYGGLVGDTSNLATHGYRNARLVVSVTANMENLW
jgi:hypothetical protein